MNSSFLPPDDLPSWVPSDLELCWELNDVVSDLFYNSCDEETQRLLSKCGWKLTTGRDGLTLVLICPKNGLTWQILKSLENVGQYLHLLGEQARIRIYPPPKTGSPMNVII